MNPRHKERTWARAFLNFGDGVLNALDNLEHGKSLQEAIGDGFRKARERAEATQAERPIGFQQPVTVDVKPVEVPRCAPHDIPINLCFTCKQRGDV